VVRVNPLRSENNTGRDVVGFEIKVTVPVQEIRIVLSNRTVAS
jgi:hypothetical protein